MKETSIESYAEITDRRVGHSRGFVLITVLLFLALLAVIVLTLNRTVKLDIQAKANLRSHAEAELLADGIVLTLSALLTEQLAGAKVISLPASGQTGACLVDGATIEFSITDVVGLIDLNTAPAELLARVIEGVGQPPASAKTAAAAIADFRDIDDEVSPYGAETRDYEAAGRAFGPKNAPFETVEELDLVLGMRPDLLNRLRGVVTVNSRAPALDIQLSPPDLLRALTRGKTGEGTRITSAEILGAGSGTRSGAHLVTAQVTTASGGRFGRSATIEVTRSSGRGFAIREWTSFAENASNAVPAGPLCAAFGAL